MPYKNPEEKRESVRKWRERVMKQGYGRWLYQRRKLRFEDATRFRMAIMDALEHLSVIPLESQATPASNAIAVLTEALRESEEAEEALGPWKGDDDGQEGS